MRRAALVALDQMVGGNLSVSDVAPLLTAADPLLSETAKWILGHHPDSAGSYRRLCGGVLLQ